MRKDDGTGKMEKENKKIKRAAAVTLFVLCGIYFGGMFAYAGRFLANTQINGVNVSGMTVNQAEERIKQHTENYELVLKERGARKEVIYAKDIGYHYVPDREISKLQSTQAYAFWFVGYFKKTSYEIETEICFEQEALLQKAEVLECFSKEISKEPENAKILFNGTRFTICKEKQGAKIKKKKFQRLLLKAVANRKTFLDLEQEKCYKTPQITSDDENLKKELEQRNHYADIEITYCFGEKKEVLNGEVIKDWLECDENGKVIVKDGAIRDYVEALAKKYDTYDKEHKFQTSDGSYVMVKGGSYGWKIDCTAEAEELTRLMEEEPHMERTACFAQTAQSWENGDLGDTYVEVDLTKQHLWMYKEGKQIMESDFVSGKMTRERRTPEGIYKVYYKKSPAVLRSNKPGDSYESPVNFWMPFNGGVGFHDASWRGSFGGEIFWNNGSHGCINLPYKAAKTLYENIEKGFPVVCFYRNGE